MGGSQRGQQQSATQTLRVHLLGNELTLLIVFGINFKSVIENCFGDQFLGCVKEICISPPLRLDVPPLWDYTYTPEITLTL